LALRVRAGSGAKLRLAMDQFIRALVKTIPGIINDAVAIESVLEKAFVDIKAQIKIENGELQKFESYLMALRQDIFDSLEVFQPAHSAPANAAELALPADGDGMLESYLLRFRANLLVDHRQQTEAPVIYDDDPTFQSL